MPPKPTEVTWVGYTIKPSSHRPLDAQLDSRKMENWRNPGERAKIEYSTQCFGFPPDSMIDALMGDATDIIQANFKAARLHCTKQFGEKVSETDLKEAFETLEGRCIESTEDIYCKKFGRYLRENIFNIPKDVILPEDRVHCDPGRENVDFKDLEAAKTRFESLCSDVKDHKFLKASLRNKLKCFKAILERQEKTLSEARQLKETAKIMEVFDAQKTALDKKKAHLKPLVEKMENNVQNDSGFDTSSDPISLDKKRQFDREDVRLGKRCKLDD